MKSISPIINLSIYYWLSTNQWMFYYDLFQILIPDQLCIIIMMTSKSYDKGIVTYHIVINGMCSLKTYHSYCITNRRIVRLIPMLQLEDVLG
jgi:hypothetical protein